MPTRLLLGTDIELDARIGPGDRDLVRQATAGWLPLALGPFALGSVVLSGNQIQAAPAGQPVLSLVAWCSDLVPLAPAIAGNR